MTNINAIEQIGIINESLRWIKKYKPQHYEERFNKLVEQRRKLRQIADAQKEKPAIAAFGESQKGKSYLIGNLLQKQKTTFKVKNEHGEEVDFVAKVNPIGDKREATGVVTRFTSFNTAGGDARYSKKHPVIVKLFRISDLATILCDSYHKDLIDTQYYSDEEYSTMAANIYSKYNSLPEQPQNILTEDDILDIKDYVTKYVNKSHGILRSSYFERLSLVIRKVPQSEWTDVLDILWHKNPEVTALFHRMLNSLATLKFSREVYVDFDAVMHLGNNRNTIMSVDCLNGLDDAAWTLKTMVYLSSDSNDGVEFLKCELCALCAETVFKIEPSYLTDEEEYFYIEGRESEAGCLTSRTYGQISHTVKKDVLSQTDLLDFPGARSRLQLKEEFLSNMDRVAGASNIVQMLLRGKVSYLFNSYNENRIINILLFCHDQENNSVTDMFQLIDNWVRKFVGEDSQARSRTIKSCGNVSPLFIVGTKFNIDMIEKQDVDANNDNALNDRWSGRFMKVMYTQILKADDVDWFRNWDKQGETFKNTYLLRDFKYSGCDGGGNNLYDGYNIEDQVPQEKKLVLTPDFYERLRKTFVINSDVAKFFADPEVSWDVAATMNNDGSLYIIEKLGIVANHMSVAREDQFAAECKIINANVRKIMKEYYVTDDTTEILKENIVKANGVFRDLEFTCQENPGYFGHLIQGLQLSEAVSFSEIHALVPKLNQTVQSSAIKDYELIRSRCDFFQGCVGEEEKWDRLCDVYNFESISEAEDFLRLKHIDSYKLFEGETVKRKNSAVIASDLVALWESRITSVQFASLFSGGDLVGEISLSNLVSSIVASANIIGLKDRIESEISDYVDVLNQDINESLVADIIATTISDFVLDFGYHWLSDEDIKNARRIAKDNSLHCFDVIDKERKEEYDEDDFTTLFNDILSSDSRFTPAYRANFDSYLEYMYVAHIAHIAVPEYDKAANEKLKLILDELDK